MFTVELAHNLNIVHDSSERFKDVRNKGLRSDKNNDSNQFFQITLGRQISIPYRREGCQHVIGNSYTLIGIGFKMELIAFDKGSVLGFQLIRVELVSSKVEQASTEIGAREGNHDHFKQSVDSFDQHLVLHLRLACLVPSYKRNHILESLLVKEL